jgi:hypothetical protein
MTEKLIMDALMIAAAVVAGASVINQMTPDADRHPQFAKWIEYLSMNVRKAQNDPHNHPWTTLAMQMADPNDFRNRDDVPNCGYIRPGEWQCNCKHTEEAQTVTELLHRPCKVRDLRARGGQNIERPNRRAAIEATKRKQEARRALVG